MDLEKAKGSDRGMSAHIERTIDPKNADKKRTYLKIDKLQKPNYCCPVNLTAI